MTPRVCLRQQTTILVNSLRVNALRSRSSWHVSQGLLERKRGLLRQNFREPTSFIPRLGRWGNCPRSVNVVSRTENTGTPQSSASPSDNASAIRKMASNPPSRPVLAAPRFSGATMTDVHQDPNCQVFLEESERETISSFIASQFRPWFIPERVNALRTLPPRQPRRFASLPEKVLSNKGTRAPRQVPLHQSVVERTQSQMTPIANY